MGPQRDMAGAMALSQEEPGQEPHRRGRKPRRRSSHWSEGKEMVVHSG